MPLEYTDTYQQIRDCQPGNWKAMARSYALDLLAASRHIRKDQHDLQKPRVQFLYIHHVFRDEEAAFRRLLDFLARDHHFISYTEAWERVVENRIDKPYIAFSSDDGLKNNLAAAGILGSYGASACFFICPAMIGEQDPDRIGQFCSERLHFPPVEFLDWKDVAVLQHAGHEIGSHTMSHILISETDPARVREEIHQSKEILDARCGPTRHFAYPYGLHHHFSERGRRAVRAAGYQSCASAVRGCHIALQGKSIAASDLLIRRDHIILNWPLEHIRFFLSRASRRAVESNHFFPRYADSDSN